LLFSAVRNNDPSVRMDSLALLAQRSSDANVRQAMTFALRYDANPGVRFKALEGLKSYVKTDLRVRDSLLGALLNDANPGVRTEALRSLQAVRADSSVRSVLEKLAHKDDSRYIRSQARTELAELPEIY
jgi:HEAT repeat protein